MQRLDGIPHPTRDIESVHGQRQFGGIRPAVDRRCGYRGDGRRSAIGGDAKNPTYRAEEAVAVRCLMNGHKQKEVVRLCLFLIFLL